MEQKKEKKIGRYRRMGLLEVIRKLKPNTNKKIDLIPLLVVPENHGLETSLDMYKQETAKALNFKSHDQWTIVLCQLTVYIIKIVLYNYSNVTHRNQIKLKCIGTKALLKVYQR